MTVKVKIIGFCAFGVGLIGGYIWGMARHEKERKLKEKSEKEKMDFWKEVLRVVNSYEQNHATAENAIKDQVN